VIAWSFEVNMKVAASTCNGFGFGTRCEACCCCFDRCCWGCFWNRTADTGGTATGTAVGSTGKDAANLLLCNSRHSLCCFALGFLVGLPHNQHVPRGTALRVERAWSIVVMLVVFMVVVVVVVVVVVGVLLAWLVWLVWLGRGGSTKRTVFFLLAAFAVVDIEVERGKFFFAFFLILSAVTSSCELLISMFSLGSNISSS